MQLNITINTENAAFGTADSAQAEECARILRQLADRMDRMQEMPAGWMLRDSNGNAVGEATTTGAEEPADPNQDRR